MSYSFVDRYSTLTANLPQTGIVTLTGWIILADEFTLLMTDECNNHTLIKREQLVGSIVVLEKQRKRNGLEILSEKGMCEMLA
jgi:hypothetical protein